MGATFRHPDRDAIEVSTAQSLATQAREAAAWLGQPGNARRVSGWTLELSMCSSAQEDPAPLRHVLPCDLMELLADHGIRLILRIDPSTDAPQIAE